MTKKDWLKVIVLILVPVNAWLGVLYYLHWQKRGRGELVETFRFNTAVRVTHFAEKWGIKEGQRLVYPFPIGNTPSLFLGVPRPLGKGVLYCSSTYLGLLQRKFGDLPFKRL